MAAAATLVKRAIAYMASVKAFKAVEQRLEETEHCTMTDIATLPFVFMPTHVQGF